MGDWQRVLSDDSSRLFHPSQSNVEVIEWPSNTNPRRRSSTIITTCDELNKHHQNTEDGKIYVYIVRQKYSWGELEVTEDVMTRLLSLNDVFLSFFDCISCFGYRKNDDDHAWEGLHRTTQEDQNSRDTVIGSELCYLFRYMALNGRAGASPWSLRQSAIYHRIDFSKKRNVWILIQPEPEALEMFLRATGDIADSISTEPNLIFLKGASSPWKNFTCYLRQSLQKLDEKACFSRVGRAYQNDYELTFADSQRLQNLREKLFRTILTLESSLDIINSFERHFRDVNKFLGQEKPTTGTYHEIESVRCNILYYDRVIKKLLKHSSGTERLLAGILSFRQEESCHKCQQSVQTEVSLIRTVATIAQQDSKALGKLAEESHQNSKVMKAFSIMATLYLPASLIASIFSSSLIQAQPFDETTKTRLTVTSDIWKYFFLAGPTVFLTFLYTLWINGSLRRPGSKRTYV